MSDGTIICSRCGAANEPGDKYCYQCGAPLAVQPPPEPVAATPETVLKTEPSLAAPPAPAEEESIPPPPKPTESGVPSAAPTTAAAGAEVESIQPAPPPPPGPESRAGAQPEWPFEVSSQQEAHRESSVPPPATWAPGMDGPAPIAESATSYARYIVLAGIGLLVLSCLWVFLSIGTHLQARFGIFCLAPLGLVFLVVGLFLMLSRGSNRRA